MNVKLRVLSLLALLAITGFAGATQAAAAPKVVSIGAHNSVICPVLDDGTFECFGEPSGFTPNMVTGYGFPIPDAIRALKVQSIIPGDGLSGNGKGQVLTQDGRLVHFGPTFTESVRQDIETHPVHSLTKAMMNDAGRCLLSGGHAYCEWDESEAPTFPNYLSTWVDLGPADKVVEGFISACTLRQGAVRCFYYDGWMNHKLVPIALKKPFTQQKDLDRKLVGVTNITAEDNEFCALRRNDGPICWSIGRDGDYNVALDYGQWAVPADVQDAKAIVNSGFMTCALRANGTIKCWGITNYIDSDYAEEGRPAIEALSGVEEIQGTAGIVCARAAGVMYCYGERFLGSVFTDHIPAVYPKP